MSSNIKKYPLKRKQQTQNTPIEEDDILDELLNEEPQQKNGDLISKKQKLFGRKDNFDKYPKIRETVQNPVYISETELNSDNQQEEVQEGEQQQTFKDKFKIDKELSAKQTFLKQIHDQKMLNYPTFIVKTTPNPKFSDAKKTCMVGYCIEYGQDDQWRQKVNVKEYKVLPVKQQRFFDEVYNNL